MSSSYNTIERLIDKHEVADVLLMIKDIMQEKAERINVSYQDVKLADKWVEGAVIIGLAVRKLPKVPGIK